MDDTSVRNMLEIAGTAILGAMGYKVVERFLVSRTQEQEQASFRSELREELDALREQIIDLKKEVDRWRERYYEQVGVNNMLQIQLSTIRLELDDYKAAFNSGETKLPDYDRPDEQESM